MPISARDPLIKFERGAASRPNLGQCQLAAHPRHSTAREECLLSLRVFGCLPFTGVSGRTEAGVRKAWKEETAAGVHTDADVGLWGICRRCLI
jgi:hypothetical protein